MKLKEATLNDIPYLREETKKHFPCSLTVHGLFEVAFRYGINDINKSKVYIPEDKESPLFVFAVDVVDIPIQNTCCFWDITKCSDEEIKDTLKEIPNWDWTKPVHFNACSSAMLEKLNIFLPGVEGLTEGKTQLSRLLQGSAYLPFKENMDPERFSKEDFEIKRVDPSLSNYIFSKWKANYSDSSTSIKIFLENLPSAGAFPKKQNSHKNKGEYHEISELPVSWTILKHDGDIGLTVTLPEYRNLGLATGVTKWLVNTCLREEFFNYIIVVDRDEASVRLHDKLGYIKNGTFGFMYYFPEGGFESYINNNKT